MRKFVVGNQYSSSSGFRRTPPDMIKILEIDEEKDRISIKYTSPSYFSGHRTNDVVSRLEYTKKELDEFLKRFDYKKY
jgi:hypothetical protein